jgi:hypothetical protein
MLNSLHPEERIVAGPRSGDCCDVSRRSPVNDWLVVLMTLCQQFRMFKWRLEDAGIAISRDGQAPALDNVFVERLWWSVFWSRKWGPP